MSKDKPLDPEEKLTKSAEANSGIEKGGHISPEDQAKLKQQDTQKDHIEHDHMVSKGILPTLEISGSKANQHKDKPEEKGFFTGLVEGATNAMANAEKQASAMIDGAKHGIDETMKKAGVPDSIRKDVNEGVNQVSEAIKDPEKAVGQVLDGAEAAIDQGLKNAGVSDDVRKNVDGVIHTIRRIDEAEVKLLKGAVKGTENLVGGLVHGAAEFTAETLDKAEEYKKKNPVDVTGAASLGAAAAETLGKAVVNTLGAAEKFGEQLRKDSDKEGGLDKLAGKKLQEAGQWIAETNIENVGEKAEQVGEKLPDAALLAAGGMGLAKAAAESAEALNALNTTAKISEASEAAVVTTGAVTESADVVQASEAVKVVETITNGSDNFTLLSNGEAIVEGASGESKLFTYFTRNDGETVILCPKNASPLDTLKQSIVIDKDTGIVSEGLVKPGKGMYRDPETFEQALKDLPEASKFVGKGQDRIAFETPNGDVFVFGPIQKRPPCPVLAQPLDVELRPPYMQIERFKKLDVTEVKQHHIDLVKEQAQKAGWQILDDHPANFGIDKDGNVFTLDPEGVVPIEVG